MHSAVENALLEALIDVHFNVLYFEATDVPRCHFRAGQRFSSSSLKSQQDVLRTSERPGARTSGTRPGEDGLAQNGDDVTRGHHRH